MKAVVNFNVQNLRIIVINQETNKNLKPILRVTLGIKDQIPSIESSSELPNSINLFWDVSREAKIIATSDLFYF